MSKQLSVEVVYLDRGHYKSRKRFAYQDEQAWQVFQATVDKFRAEKTPALVMVRDGETDGLIKSERT